MRQLDLFAKASKPLAQQQPQTPDPVMIRGRLHAWLETARTATENPWDEQGARKYRVLFHQMANWLPAAERDALRLEFLKQLERLGIQVEPIPDYASYYHPDR